MKPSSINNGMTTHPEEPRSHATTKFGKQCGHGKGGKNIQAFYYLFDTICLVFKYTTLLESSVVNNQERSAP